MLPLLPFAAGIATGALAIKLWRNEKVRQTVDNARDKLRQTTANSLAKLEHSSATMREKLTQTDTETENTTEQKTAESTIIQPESSNQNTGTQS